LPAYIVTDTALQKIIQDCEQTRREIQQQREKAGGYLLQLEAMCQEIAEGLTALQEQQTSLQSGITGTLTTFEEKAGASQGLQGLFHGNPQLKQDIMQKRGVLEQNCRTIHVAANKLSHTCGQLYASLQDVELLMPYFEQCEKELQALAQDLGQLSANQPPPAQAPQPPSREPALQ